MKKVILNHKMNLTYNEVENYIDYLDKVKKNIIVLPSSLYVKKFIDSGFITGLQNVYFDDTGAYTGEISAYQAKSLGVEYALIGHSERRNLFNEDSDIINKKIKSAIKNGLKVILCVGESSKDVLYKQITSALEDVNEDVIISYEPIYAIGTGVIPKLEDVEEKINYIKSLVNTKVLYGGSVNSSNIDELNKVKNIDGFLIGSAGLDPEEVMKILEVVW